MNTKKSVLESHTLTKTLWVMIILPLFLIVLSSVSVSATLSINNYVDFSPIAESKYGKIDIWNGNIIFPDSKLATYTLEENTEQCLIDCHASGTATLYQDGTLFDDVKFLNGNVKTSKVILINGESYQIDVPDYKEECTTISEEIDKNGTIIKEHEECNHVQTGTHKEIRQRDVEYKNENLQSGTYSWRIEGTKILKDEIDWIVNSNGVDLDQWAWWNSSWLYKQQINISTNNITSGESLTNYPLLIILNSTNFNFTKANADGSDLRFLNLSESGELSYEIESYDQAGQIGYIWVNIPILTAGTLGQIYIYYGNTVALTTQNKFNVWDADYIMVDHANEGAGGLNSSTGINNASVTGTITRLTGMIDGYAKINAVDNTLLQIADNPTLDVNNYTFSAWVNASVITGVNRYIFDRGDSAVYSFLIEGTTGYIWINNADCGVQVIKATSVALTTNTWNYISATYNHTNVQLMVNGVGVGNLASSGNCVGGTDVLGIGRRTSDNLRNFNGSISEARISNQARSMSYMKMDYWAGKNNILLFGSEQNNPVQSLTVSLSSPINFYNSTSSSVTFNCSATDETAVLNLTLLINGADNYTITNSSANQNLSLQTSVILADGDHYWNCRGSDGTGSSDPATATARNFTIDTTKPSVTIVSPTAATYAYRNISLNYTAADTHLQTCWFSLNGKTNITLTSCSNSTIYIAPRNNSLIVYANDTLGNVGNSTMIYPYYFPSLGLCNSTNDLKFINITFKNETLLQQTVKASIASTYTYWFDQVINRTLSYTNTTENLEYTFCIDGANETINVNPDIDYYNVESPQRTYTTSFTATNGSRNITLFLLPTSLGLYISFQITDRANSPIVSASVNATNSGNLIEEKITDGAGIATMFLNPNQGYTICASKSGYTQSCVAITPTQTQYTIQLSSTSTSTTDYTRGITYSIQPMGSSLSNGTSYSFNFTINSTYWTLDSWGFRLYDSSNNLMNSTSDTTSSGTLNVINNVFLNKSILINAYWIINSTTTNITKAWIVYNSFEGSWSIRHFFTRFDSYTNASGDSDGLFGLQRNSNNSFSFSLIIFLIIFGFAGILSYQYGLNSPAAIMAVVFGMVFFFDVTLEILPRFASASSIPSATIITAVIMIAFLVKEVQR